VGAQEGGKKYVEKDILDCYGITTSQKKEMLNDVGWIGPC
jgi:hypothetical protein